LTDTKLFSISPEPIGTVKNMILTVIGTPQERLGEIVTAVIQSISDAILTEADIIAFCEEHLPRYRRPRMILFDNVPRNPTGKIEKNKLRKKYC